MEWDQKKHGVNKDRAKELEEGVFRAGSKGVGQKLENQYKKLQEIKPFEVLNEEDENAKLIKR